MSENDSYFEEEYLDEFTGKNTGYIHVNKTLLKTSLGVKEYAVTSYMHEKCYVMYEMGSYRVLLTKISRFVSSRNGRYALPFLLLVVGGSFGLKKFTEIRYTYGKQVTVFDKAKEAGVNMKDPSTVTLDTVYESIKDLDIDNWENKRGPRPWENENEQ